MPSGKSFAKQRRCDWRCGYIVVYWAVYMRFALAGGVVLDMEHTPEMPLEFVGLTQLILSALGSLRAGEFATTLGLHTFMTDAIDSGVLDFAAMQVQLEEYGRTGRSRFHSSRIGCERKAGDPCSGSSHSLTHIVSQ